jgi:hypothetical protein
MARLFAVAISILGWFAIGLQFYLILINRNASVVETIIRFFSYFTILTNILIAIYFTVLSVNPKSRWATFCKKTSTATVVLMYILLVGLGYQFLLRHIWDPQGWQWVADELLHSVIPVCTLAYWVWFIPKSRVSLASILSWTIYPVLYFGFVILRGQVSGFYPYYFIDINQLGFSKVILNSLALLAGFLLLSFMMTGLIKLVSSNQPSS